MNLAIAKDYAEKISIWITPYCQDGVPSIVGSIRRQRPICNDIDIVCIPHIVEQTDMFGTVIKTENRLHQFLSDYVETSNGNAKFISGGDKPGKLILLELPKCQLDLWFATPETFATRMMCRTGSAEHNIWLASRAKRMGVKWNPYEGLFSGGEWRKAGDRDEYLGGTLQQFASETEIYAALELPFIDPKDRELPYLTTHFGS
jgi:DNA polymerase/3'-5' exonuclease PolX